MPGPRDQRSRRVKCRKAQGGIGAGKVGDRNAGEFDVIGICRPGLGVQETRMKRCRSRPARPFRLDDGKTLAGDAQDGGAGDRAGVGGDGEVDGAVAAAAAA